MEVARGEGTEAELARLIEKRAREGDPEVEHELWKARVPRYYLARPQERGAACAGHHRRTIDVCEALPRQHRDWLLRLVDGGEGVR
jgi:hypothetical protein